MLSISSDNRDRMKSAAGVAAFHALLGYAFLTGLGFEMPGIESQELKMFDVFEQPPPPPAQPAAPEKVKKSKEPKPKDPEGAASPANLRDTPSPVVAPEPEIKLPVPPPVIAAPVPGQGSADDAGAADVPGPGTGRGGIGNGLGSGRYGTGTGGGGGGLGMGVARHARWISGRIRDSDYPDSAFRARAMGTVYLRFIVAPSGRVSDCRVTRSSGSRALDETTCRLIVQRFRYRPARDEYGRPIPEEVRGKHVWELGPEPPPIDIEPDIPDDE